MRIIENRNKFFSLSILIIVLGLVFLLVNKGFNYDIEFSGGTLLHYNIGQEFDEKSDIMPIVKEVTGDNSPQVQAVVGKQEVVIKTKQIDEATEEKLFNKLVEKYNLTENDKLNSTNISATISSEMKQIAMLSVSLAALAMLIYITIRFRDLRFGVSAVLALVHDVLVMLALYAIFNIPLNNSFIAAMLTIVGYSINDTIVLFDRIRENSHKMKRREYTNLVNTSIKQTLSRTINTSLTTFVMIFLLYMFGVRSIREFALPIMFGVLCGTYSSIFIASPIWYLFYKKNDVTASKA